MPLDFVLADPPPKGGRCCGAPAVPPSLCQVGRPGSTHVCEEGPPWMCMWIGPPNINHHLSLSDSDRLRLLVDIYPLVKNDAAKPPHLNQTLRPQSDSAWSMRGAMGRGEGERGNARGKCTGEVHWGRSGAGQVNIQFVSGSIDVSWQLPCHDLLVLQRMRLTCMPPASLDGISS